jgi:hypothetical protein
MPAAVAVTLAVRPTCRRVVVVEGGVSEDLHWRPPVSRINVDWQKLQSTPRQRTCALAGGSSDSDDETVNGSGRKQHAIVRQSHIASCGTPKSV